MPIENIASAGDVRNRYWDNISGEHDIEITEIEGTLPRELVGTLYRNGSGRWSVGADRVAGIFDTDGMITAFVLTGDRVYFRNRFVRTRHFTRANAAGGLVQRGFASQRPGGLAANAFRLPPSTANTNVELVGDSLLALHEIGRPHRIDPDTLGTLDVCDLGGVLRGPVGAYSAHYCRDPIAGVDVNFGFDPYFPRIDLRWVFGTRDRVERRRRLRELLGEAVPRLRLRLYETGRGGTRYLRSVPLPGGRIPLIHDMGLTQRYAVFVVSPFRVHPRALLGAESYWDSSGVVAGEPTYLVLAPRDGGRVRVVETDPFHTWHCTNAYDDGDDVVVDLTRYSPAAVDGMRRWLADIRSDRITAMAGDLTAEQAEDAAQLARYRITASGRVHYEPVTEISCEFPQFDQRRSTGEHTVSYVAEYPHDRTDDVGIARIDHRAGTTQRYCPPDQILVEPTFVPRAPDAPEHDGWVLTIGYDRIAHRSRLMIFDAAHVDAGPITQAWLDFHVPMSFHGLFTDRVALVR